ncbi:MAG TPA: DUF1569 domain-containing protein [Gemmatimonadaceae bacterium]|nr:DUF1569 domain-containing protein [Gemmatimonadaceae bacterium]
MKTLANRTDVDVILARLRRLTPESRRRWGRMSAHEMLCHLADAHRHVLGLRPVRPAQTLWRRTGLKWIALWMPVRWPHGVKTRRELDPQREGTKPELFARDLEMLEELTRRFVEAAPAMPGSHPLFGKMSEGEWLRFGWLHLDHHLRQFGV